jgi:hypothetical protein
MIKLFTVIFGSQLYGTNTPESDTDLKTIYLPDLSDMLVGNKLETIKVRDSKPTERTKAGEIEEECIPIQTFAQHFLKSQTYAIEICFAYQDKARNVVYVNRDYEPAIDDFINALIVKFLNKNINSMVGYAQSQSMKYSLKTERLEEIEKLILVVKHYINLNSKGENTGLAKIANKIYDTDKSKPIFITEMTSSRTGITEPALSIGNKLYSLRTKLPHFIKALNILKEKYGERTKEGSEGTDWKSVSHAIRIVKQANELLTTNKISFPVTDAELLLSVKQGKLLRDDAYKLFDDEFVKLESSQKNFKLQDLTTDLENSFNSWLQLTMKLMYQRQFFRRRTDTYDVT